jgi:hypothetical protein
MIGRRLGVVCALPLLHVLYMGLFPNDAQVHPKSFHLQQDGFQVLNLAVVAKLERRDGVGGRFTWRRDPSSNRPAGFQMHVPTALMHVARRKALPLGAYFANRIIGRADDFPIHA